jgi:hypothetical protein
MIPQKKVKQYWKNRYAKQGSLTTGYVKHNAEEQAEYYKEKKAFISSVLPDDLGTVLDYGSGKDRLMASLFDEYKSFDLIDGVPFMIKEFDTFFTSNVLQHNDEKECLRILKLAKKAKYIILYEATVSEDNTPIKRPHCISRKISDYEKLVNKSTCKLIVEAHTHIIHNSSHSLMIFV